MRRSTFLLALAVAALLAPAALAQTCSTEWATPVDGSWTDDTKWTNGAPGTDSGGLNPCITVAGTYAVSYDIGVFAGSDVNTFVLGGASGTQTLMLFSALGVTDASIQPNGLLIPVGNVGASQGLYATGTVTLEGVVDYGSGSFLRSGGTLDIAPSGTLRLSGQTGAGAASGLFRVRGTVEGVGCPVPNAGSCNVDAPVEVLGGTIRAADGVVVLRAGGTMNGATLDAGPTGFLTLNANLVSERRFVVEGTLSGTPQGQVGMAGISFAAGPAGATLAVGGTGLQMVRDVVPDAARGGSFTNTGLLLKAATGSNFSGLGEVIVRNQGVVEIPSSLGLYAGSVLRNEPGGVVRATAAGRCQRRRQRDGPLRERGPVRARRAGPVVHLRRRRVRQELRPVQPARLRDPRPRGHPRPHRPRLAEPARRRDADRCRCRSSFRGRSSPRARSAPVRTRSRSRGSPTASSTSRRPSCPAS